VTQFSILAAIARMGEASLKQLEDALAVDQTTLTRGLGLLERDGLIERGPHPDGGSRRCGSRRKAGERWTSRAALGRRKTGPARARDEGVG